MEGKKISELLQILFQKISESSILGGWSTNPDPVSPRKEKTFAMKIEKNLEKHLRNQIVEEKSGRKRQFLSTVIMRLGLYSLIVLIASSLLFLLFLDFSWFFAGIFLVCNAFVLMLS